jgi:hypothetical protein
MLVSFSSKWGSVFKMGKAVCGGEVALLFIPSVKP